MPTLGLDNVPASLYDRILRLAKARQRTPSEIVIEVLEAASGVEDPRLYVFEHSSMLGSAPAHELFDRVVVARKGAEGAPRSFDDYRGGITVRKEGMPEGVTLHTKVGGP
jgi:hypothetical protein